MADHFEKKPFDVKADLFPYAGQVYSFRGNEHALEFPRDLVMNTGMCNLESDVHCTYHGIIFSQRFNDLLTDHDRSALRIANLQVVNRQNSSTVDQPYYFAKFTRISNCVDRQNQLGANTSAKIAA